MLSCFIITYPVHYQSLCSPSTATKFVTVLISMFDGVLIKKGFSNDAEKAEVIAVPAAGVL